VLDAVNALRFASTPLQTAGPPGIDRACAQLIPLAFVCWPAPHVMAEFDDGLVLRYAATTSPMPHGIPFTSPDVKR
jgi:hypothetical protein